MKRGGQNKAHDTVAHYDRLDSFQIGTLRGVYAAFWASGGSIVLDCLEECVGLFYSVNNPPERVELSRVANRYGGDRSYFICPGCGRRVRFLYRRDLFRCRSCWRLNYPSQQERPSEIGAYRQGVKLLRERFKLSPAQIPTRKAFYDFVPPRPKGMHRLTYGELYRQLELLQGGVLPLLLHQDAQGRWACKLGRTGVVQGLVKGIKFTLYLGVPGGSNVRHEL